MPGSQTNAIIGPSVKTPQSAECGITPGIDLSKSGLVLVCNDSKIKIFIICFAKNTDLIASTLFMTKYICCKKF